MSNVILVLSRLYSSLLTLFFVSLQLEAMLERSEMKEFFIHSLWPLTWLVLKLYTFVFMGYCLVPFVLLSFSRWNHVYASVYYFGHFMFFLWPFYAPFVKKLLKLFKARSHQEWNHMVAAGMIIVHSVFSFIQYMDSLKIWLTSECRKILSAVQELMFIIIIMFINCKWVDTRWQWSVFICTDNEVWLL
jgi:hypothetical protein